MRFLNRNLLIPAVVLLFGSVAAAQTYNFAGIGTPATPEMIKPWDISISPDGRELPDGHGNAKDGKVVFTAKCAVCHGPTGEESKLLFARLVGGRGTLTDRHIIETPGSFWPYATSIFDFIQRAMPEVPLGPNSFPKNGWIFTQPPYPALESGMSGIGSGPMGYKEGQLTPDQIYSVVAFILWRNDIIKEDDEMNKQTLPKVVMPNIHGFKPPADQRWVWTRRDPDTRIEPHVAPNSKPLPPGSQPVNEVY